MLKKKPKFLSPLRIISKNSDNENKRYRIINSLKKLKPKSHKDYELSGPLSDRNSISHSLSIPNNIDNNPLKSQMPYIPNKERQKAETNFINLINALANSKKNIVNDNNLFNKKQNNIPYKPKGYNYYEYIRMHPVIINEDENNIYSKIVNDLQKKTEIEKNNNNQITKSHKNLNSLTINKKVNNIPFTEGNDKIKVNPILIKSYKYLNTINNNSYDNEVILNNDRKTHKTIDYDDNNIKRKIINNIFPNINDKSININDNYNSNYNNKQKDYKQSDIFYLINDNLSKNKSSEQYLFKKNYMPPKIENEKKTSIIKVGWLPKFQSNKSRIGCSSVAFNIISPGLKNTSPMKKDIDLLNKNNFEKPPLMSEYVDISKAGDTPARQDYCEKLNENKNVFHKKNYCAAYNDLHHEYKDLINKLF